MVTAYQCVVPGVWKKTLALATLSAGEKRASNRGYFPATTHPTGAWSMVTAAARAEEPESARTTKTVMRR
jgi:hypothetical protein